jgi:outer membrane protein assembly factor BamA
VRLHLHQLFDRKKPTKLSNWIINNLAEPPVIYDSTLSRISVIQIQQLLMNNGYFLAKVKYEDTTRKKQTNVIYHIEPNQAYHIRNIQYTIKDSIVQSIYFYKLNESLLQIGMQFDQTALANERDRITKYLRNFGYYYFNREYIHFDIDTALKSHQLDINVIIENPEKANKHESFKLKNIETTIISDNIKTGLLSDTIELNNVKFIHTKNKIQAKILRRMLFLERGKKFNEDDLLLSYNRLGDLGIFKYINIDFEKDSIDSTQLNASVQLRLAKKQSTNTEL